MIASNHSSDSAAIAGLYLSTWLRFNGKQSAACQLQPRLQEDHCPSFAHVLHEHSSGGAKKHHGLKLKHCRERPSWMDAESADSHTHVTELVKLMQMLTQAILLADRASHLGTTLYLWGFVLLAVAMAVVARPLLSKWRSRHVPDLTLPIALLRQTRSSSRLRGD